MVTARCNDDGPQQQAQMSQRVATLRGGIAMANISIYERIKLA